MEEKKERRKAKNRNRTNQNQKTVKTENGKSVKIPDWNPSEVPQKRNHHLIYEALNVPTQLGSSCAIC